MGNDVLLTYNIECIEGSVCEETKEEMTIVIKDDFAKCPMEKAEVPLAGKVQLYRSQDNGEKENLSHSSRFVEQYS